MKVEACLTLIIEAENVKEALGTVLSAIRYTKDIELDSMEIEERQETPVSYTYYPQHAPESSITPGTPGFYKGTDQPDPLSSTTITEGAENT
jgi:hypothetical protein